MNAVEKSVLTGKFEGVRMLRPDDNLEWVQIVNAVPAASRLVVMTNCKSSTRWLQRGG